MMDRERTAYVSPGEAGSIYTVLIKVYNGNVYIQNHIALISRLLFKARKMMNTVFKSVPPSDNVDILSLYLESRKNTLK